MSLFEELKRRNVFRVTMGYIVSCWLLAQVADLVLENIGAPDWAMKTILLVFVLGFPVAVFFSWAYEVTPEGVKRESEVNRSESITHVTANRLNWGILITLVLALAFYAYDRLVLTPEREAVLASPAIEADAQEVTPSPGLVPDSDKSIAVLPFVDLSPDGNQEYFSDGISEELLNVLAQYPDLRVAARTSSFQFKGENQDISEIARQLRVNHVLEGSVRKAGTRLRITAQLIDAQTGFHLWSENYDRELDDVFAIQDEISAAIGDALHAQLELGNGQLATSPRVTASENTAAYEAFLQGRHLINQRGNKNIESAVELLERCVRLDPDFAPCHAWLAIGYTMLLSSPATYGDLSLAEVNERATPHIETALELDPALAEAHGAKALLAINSNRYVIALEQTDLALELNSVYVDALNWQQVAAGGLGEYSLRKRSLKKMMEIDPLSIIGRLNYVTQNAMTNSIEARTVAESLLKDNQWAGYTSLAVVDLFPHGNLSSALDWFLKSYQLEPRDEFTNQFIVEILASVSEFDEARRITNKNLHIVDIEQGDPDAAAAALENDLRLDPANLNIMTDYADALHLAGRFEEAQKYYAQVLDQSPSGMVLEPRDSTLLSHLRMAFGLKQLGDSAAAQAALDQHRQDYPKRIEADVLFPRDHIAEAIAQAMSGNDSAVFAALRSAMDNGLRQMSTFNEPALASLADHPKMLALKAEMGNLLDIEHEKSLQLICHNNPAYDTWQPRRETCEGVRETSK